MSDVVLFTHGVSKTSLLNIHSARRFDSVEMSRETHRRIEESVQNQRMMDMGSSALHSYHSPEAVLGVQKLIV